jgi:hypothetical protein
MSKMGDTVVELAWFHASNARTQMVLPTTNGEAMDNQHLLIVGCRDLAKEEIDRINEVKKMANLVGASLQKIKRANNLDSHWLEVAQTQLQLGFMALDRAIAKPPTF